MKNRITILVENDLDVYEWYKTFDLTKQQGEEMIKFAWTSLLNKLLSKEMIQNNDTFVIESVEIVEE